MINQTQSSNVYQQVLFPIENQQIIPNRFANDVSDLLNRVTKRTVQKIQQLNSQMKHYKNDDPKMKTLQDEISKRLQRWNDDVRRLGAIPMGFCRCKVMTETGVFLWEYSSTLKS